MKIGMMITVMPNLQHYRRTGLKKERIALYAVGHMIPSLKAYVAQPATDGGLT